MRKLILFLVFILLIVSACSKQNPESLVGQGSNVEQDNQNQVQNEMPVPGTDVQETEVTVQPSGEAEVKEFRIAAKQFAFDPATIEVNKGDKVRLIVESVDVPHGIALPDYGIKERLDPGQPKTIEFVADKEGIFTFYCSVACGAGHREMKGTLTVN
ncbi:MAG: cupredoxin domain-containing protein [Nanoarchaeota archaeon]